MRDAQKAISYARTSSAANVGGDSEDRQMDAIRGFAERTGVDICGHVYDAAVKGADALESRPGFAQLLATLKAGDVGVVIVEAADRFARDLIVQEQGIATLNALGVRLLTASGDDLTNSSDPSRVMVRQILGAVAQHDKARVVAKLKHGRDRMRQVSGRCEGRKPAPAAAVEMARRIKATTPTMSLRRVGRRLAEAGHLAPSGKPYDHSSVRCMLE